MPSKIKYIKKDNFDLTKMCTPATIYFLISVIGLVALGITNLNTPDKLCIGDYSCYVGNNTIVFIINAIYILFWTYILNLICKDGHSGVSWLLLLFPFLLFFVIIGILMISTF